MNNYLSDTEYATTNLINLISREKYKLEMLEKEYKRAEELSRCFVLRVL